MPRRCYSWIVLLFLLVGFADAFEAPRPALKTQFRRPVALIVDGETLLVGNRFSGTVTVIQSATGRVIAEHVVAKRIADMAAIDEGRFLVLDDASRQLLSVSLNDGRPSMAPIAQVPDSATKIEVALDRRRVFVSAKWPRSVTAITLDDRLRRAGAIRTIKLPFPPRDLLLADNDQTLLVADAFRGRLVAIDAEGMRISRRRELDGHNIRGLAVSTDGKLLHVAHQVMTPRALADYEELHWGRMVINGVQVFDAKRILANDFEREVRGWLDEHGGIGDAMGDPAGVITGPNEFVAVAFSGVNEVAIRKRGAIRRFSVGAHPEAMALGDERLFVANRFDDSVSVIDLHRGELSATISLGPTPARTPVDRGEALFFNARLSHDGWISCHSCHTDGHSSGLLIDTLGDGDYGAPKRVPSLLGTRGTGPWGWTGSMPTLAEQVRKSVTTTMHGAPLTDRQTADLVAFLESLPSAPPSGEGRRELVAEGRGLFTSRGCANCHASPTFTSKNAFDVGLVDERNRRSFNPPALRGVSQRDRFFHDGRAESLTDVLTRIRHQLDKPLTRRETAALLEYLRSL